MDRINYAGDAIFTGSAIAHALLDYAQALAQVGASATVRIPTIDPAGATGAAEVLVGPASQLFSSTIVTDLPEVVDADLVTRLSAQSVRLRREGAPTSTAVLEATATDSWTEPGI